MESNSTITGDITTTSGLANIERCPSKQLSIEFFKILPLQETMGLVSSLSKTEISA
jgi:hypothetical protein